MYEESEAHFLTLHRLGKAEGGKDRYITCEFDVSLVPSRLVQCLMLHCMTHTGCLAENEPL